MRDDLTSWVVSLCSAIGAIIAVGSKAFIDPLLSVLISGILIICVGVTTIWGHVLSQPQLYQWFGKGPGMAIETALMLVVVGSGKITMAWKIRGLIKAKTRK